MIAQADAPAALEGRRRSRGAAPHRPATTAATAPAAALRRPATGRAVAVLSGALLFGAVLSGLFSQAQAAPVGDSLDRPALATRLGPASVLLAAAQAGPTTVAVGERGLVLLSADPARSWRQAQVPVSVTLTAVRFADERHGIAVGHAGVVLSTDNGGQSWQQRLNGRQIAQALLDEARAAQQTRPQPGLLAQAERLVQDGADKPLLDVALLSPRRALAVGAYGLAMASDDGGQHWAPWSARLDNPKGLHLYAVRHQGSAMLLVGEQGLLLYSSDDGAHFQRLPSPYAGSFFTAEMLSPTEFMVAGLRGQIWHTRGARQHHRLGPGLGRPAVVGQSGRPAAAAAQRGPAARQRPALGPVERRAAPGRWPLAHARLSGRPTAGA